ncbi:hypothetical protein MKZ38_005581 [Zalerion maritima]|uniref:Uncharacterized protein n=1 Tax=Zalerion maritima TaxID=339359 RepID=A0AAD5RK03_9PEZI|nr:hypothetical protein MKZ38_005581 [Zalerion maritima]
MTSGNQRYRKAPSKRAYPFPIITTCQKFLAAMKTELAVASPHVPSFKSLKAAPFQSRRACSFEVAVLIF